MDRNNKATLPFTIPSSVFKSSAKDLGSPIFEIIIQHDRTTMFWSHGECNYMALEQHRRSNFAHVIKGPSIVAF
jgi:hypothetical protein